MYTVTVHLFADTFTIPARSLHDVNCIVAEWDRLGLDAKVTVDSK